MQTTSCFNEDLKSKFLGAIIGTAVGDALGMPVQGWSCEAIKSVYGEIREMLDGWLPAGHYTDDTEMMIGVAESLIENKGFNGDHLAKTFIKNFNIHRGYGLGPIRVLRWISQGEAWDKASTKLFGSGSYGNGAAMRIAPIGIFYHDNPEELRSIAYKSSQITHAHELGKEGAALQAYSIALAVSTTPTQLETQSFLKKLSDFTRKNTVYTQKIKIIEKLLVEKPDRIKVINELGNGIEAFNSVPTAIYCFLSHPDSFEAAVIYAISLGGDTDTIGAMTGAISGAYHGVNSIPERWRQKLEKANYIEELAEKLWSTYISMRKTANLGNRKRHLWIKSLKAHAQTES